MLESGKSLLHYRLVEKIGEGGMGVVWKAVDTTLNREVAVKVLPEGFAGDTERLARFEREAKLLASLNHPNIAGIYGIHTAEGNTFLAMELIDGEDLQQRLSRGALSRDEALKVGLQIAQAFEVAHESGVIHRDLKPANVKLTRSGQVKVLDFGLAKALSQDPSNPSSVSQSLSPTLTSTGTVVGMLLGTAAYMSPEQAKGKAVDRRADIWSFGVVLLELISGRRVFEGETISETLAAVIMKEVDLGGLPSDTPTPVRRLLERCLERDPDKRLRDIGEARIRLEEAIAAPHASETPAPVTESRAGMAPRLVPWLIAAAAVAVLAWIWLGRPAETDPLPVMRFTMSIAQDQPIADAPMPTVAISPDGTRIAYQGLESDRGVIYLRQINQLEATMVKGSEGAGTPFFSTDGEWIAFESGGKLKKVSVLGGPPTTLCDAPRMRGASWSPDGTIVFTPERSGGMMRVSDAGGEPEWLTEFEVRDSLGAPSHRWPEVLPDGRTVIYTSAANNGNYTDAEVIALSLEDGSQKTLVKPANFGRFVAPGFLVYMRENTLFAARFDPVAVELTGPAVPVLEGIGASGNYGCAQLTISTNGTLIHRSGAMFSDNERLVWIHKDGKPQFASSLEDNLGRASLSPDGKLVALELISESQADYSLWVLELARDTKTRLTFDESDDVDPIWTPDGRWLTYSSNGGDETAELNLFRRRADGTGEAERLATSSFMQRATSWSPDGKLLAFTEDSDDSGSDLMLYRPGADPEVEVFLKTPFSEWLPFISPDGQWILYGSNQSGDAEIYVRSLLDGGQQIRISTDGSPMARWSPDSNELFYRNHAGKLMSVRYKVDNGVFTPESPIELFDLPSPPHSFIFQAVGGGRFLTYQDVDDTASQSLDPVVVINWSAELEAKVPHAR